MVSKLTQLVLEFRHGGLLRFNMGKQNIEICIHTYMYQRRLCWMLSSILQQTGDVPNILINISHTENDGNPTTAEVCSFFRDKGLNIKETIVPKENIGNRSLARTKQLEETQSDFILFADSDMVYATDFFGDLGKQLETNLANEPKCMGADRVSLDIPFCVEYFNKDESKYPMAIENVADIVDKWKIYYVRGRHKAAGYFQLANVKLLKDRNVSYGMAKKDGLRRYGADRYFRVNMGGICPIETKKQYHLNHSRNNDVTQR
jgi:hypothetical protein